MVINNRLIPCNFPISVKTREESSQDLTYVVNFSDLGTFTLRNSDSIGTERTSGMGGQFFIEIIDQFGNLCPPSNPTQFPFKVDVESKSGERSTDFCSRFLLTPSVPTRGKSWGDGTYSVSFTPAFVGTYEIVVKLDSQSLAVPWTFTVLPSAADVSQTVVEGFPAIGNYWVVQED